MRTVSLKNRILLLVAITGVTTVSLLFAALFAFYHFRSQALISSTTEKLEATMPGQINEILITYLIPEQAGGLRHILDRIREEEQLKEARMIDVEEAINAFPKCKLTTEPTHCWSDDGSQVYVMTTVHDRDQIFGVFLKGKAWDERWADFLPVSVILTVFFAIAFGVVFFLLARIVSYQIPKYLNDLTGWVMRVLSGEDKESAPESEYAELQRVGDRINDVVKMHLRTREENASLQKRAAVAQFAAQVAHDIRSPLTALDTAVANVVQMPEDIRLLVRSAVGRIRDIANSLLENHREVLKATRKMQEVPEPIEARLELVAPLVDAIVSEKRLQYRSQIGIHIEAQLTAKSYGLFTRVSRTQFKRVLSNLIDNSVEALGPAGRVAVSVEGLSDQILLVVKDNGCGVPEDVLPKLMEEGFTYGKAKGSGIGLSLAKNYVESWGGRIDVRSKEGSGTSVEVYMPREEAPSWFLPTLKLPAGAEIVIVDDDASIHQVWQGRLEAIGIGRHRLTVEHLTTPEQLRRYVQARRGVVARYLIDYEMIGFRENGLELIKALGIADQSVLVTSHFEDVTIIDRCEALGVSLLPKGMAAVVPIVAERPIRSAPSLPNITP